MHDHDDDDERDREVDFRDLSIAEAPKGLAARTAHAVSIAARYPTPSVALGVVGVLWVTGVRADSPWLVAGALFAIGLTGAIESWRGRAKATDST